jgi:hypothetical protein
MKGEPQNQMKEIIDAKEFGLPKSTVIEKIETDHFAILISRKSRIIMKDGIKLLAKVEQIKEHEPAATISLKTSTPLCSKTKKFLEEHHINIIAV